MKIVLDIFLICKVLMSIELLVIVPLLVWFLFQQLQQREMPEQEEYEIEYTQAERDEKFVDDICSVTGEDEIADDLRKEILFDMKEKVERTKALYTDMPGAVETIHEEENIGLYEEAD